MADIYREFKNGLGRNTPIIDSRSYAINDSVTCEPFTDRFENLLAGWKGTISITVPSHNNACNSPI